MENILVVGSINIDVVNEVQEHPLPGQTIHGKGVQYLPGGKGANQAVAASLAGGKVTIVGAIGSDSFGSQLLDSLKNYGVETQHIIKKSGTSGMASITVDSKGENTIILSKGANGEINKEDFNKLLQLFDENKILLLQNEIPWETNEFVINEAAKRGVQIFLNPAPAFIVPKEILSKVDVLILNETETETITGIKVKEPGDSKQAAELLLKEGVGNVLITMGQQGAYFYNSNGKSTFTPAFHVKAVDTTAAGDTFIGAFSVAYSLEKPIEECLRFASAAAAISVTRFGAQSSIPSIKEIRAFLEQNISIS